jgi:VanZ family protein
MRVNDWRGGAAARSIFWLVASFAFVLAILPHPPELPGEPSDKLQHIIAFASLAALASFAYPRAGLLKLLAGLSLFGALIEAVQAIPMLHRDSDVLDWLADTGAALVVLIVIRWRR